MKLLAGKEWNRTYREGGVKYRIFVRGELVHRDGNAKPYFSITGDIDRQAGNGRWMEDSGGCIHEEILKYFPQLAPLVLVHLSDDDGTPMYAYVNASYWAGQAEYQTLDIGRLATHLRVSENEATQMVRDYAGRQGTPAERWEQLCSEWNMPTRWATQAAEALALLNQVAVAV